MSWTVKKLKIVFSLTVIIIKRHQGDIVPNQRPNNLTLITDYQHLAEHVPTGIFEVDLAGHCTFSNATFKQLLGLDDQLSLGFSYTRHFHPDDKMAVVKHWCRCIKKEQAFNYTFRVHLPEQVELYLTINAVPVFKDQQLIAFIGCVEDVTELCLSQQQLKDNQQRYELALKSSGAGIWDWDILNDVVHYSAKFSDLLGFDNLLFGTSWSSWTDQIHPDDLDIFETQLQNHLDDADKPFNIECRLISQKKKVLWFTVVGEALRDEHGYPTRMVGSMVDITLKHQSQQMIWQQANFDHLTGLPNRNMFTERLKQEISESKRYQQKFALFFIDLDHFKEVNDTLGHGAGDQLLIEVAERLQLILRESDTIGRIGGDEFTALIPHINQTCDIDSLAQKLIQTIELPFYIDGESIFISASIGITLFPDHSEKIDELLKFADQAMYRSKENGRKRFSYFTFAMQEQADHTRNLTQELHLAIIEQHFHVVYQPIMALPSRKITKAEALVRWDHPELGLISPADFIPLAERSGVIIEIGNWVFYNAAKQALKWQQEIDPSFEISINRSPVQFQNPDPNADQKWVELLKNLGLIKGICIEITEGLLLDDTQGIKDKLLYFQNNGMDISLDDFGTGYSSLSYLTKFDINFLKIDRAFINDLEHNQNNQALCEAIIVMAHKLGLKVIAEGVESQRQLDFLAQAQCDFVQGYFISKPISAAAFEHQLKSPAPFGNAK
ncbi:bifunctional diguanylate cyclase/phosphodiesterase [Pseudoalteromonas tunicata]|uniref:Sensory box protein n=1 Tax=Pseudoalteromonas tunicata D2 TaxID=87626 RepID=A4C531_9GAMM|nr:bifunctional diguanylate cyclase/phosphodiesterase [Pseudoalteromonas tunicata]ATC96863.1 hypothetical protein PTUN_b0484 [Pseudoalteromonas tunicata]AXT33002.1 bifunctional diguanylate cyclase/phosphodiesterase [Pseudoalteromonas tunicata]EAR30663.1 sensory box protein [Pseudoalteromonas tunicata D2]